jgi:acyl-coenzyme A synthetase/AMP-(fatty) acid ligase
MYVGSLPAGTLFDRVAERGHPTVVHLSRPFDLAPHGGTSYDTATLAALVSDVAGWLWAAGARPGECVAIAKPNHWDCDLLAFAVARIGAVAAKLSAHLPPDTLRILIKRLDPALLVTTRAVLAAAGAGGGLTALSRRTLCLDGPDRGAVGPADVRGSAPPPYVRRHDDDPLVIVHTSGTTGTPKLVVHSHRTMMRRLAGFESVRWPLIACRRDDTVATASSFAHGRTFCWTATAYAAGAREVVVVADHAPHQAGPVLQAHPPTVLEALPAVYLRWLPLAVGPDQPFADVRMFVSTYDAIHPPAVRAYLAASRRRYPLWMQGWGQSETGPLTFRFLTRRSVRRAGDRYPTTRDVGRPVPGRTRLRLVDPKTFMPVPRGQAGLVLARTKARCLGYVDEPDRFRAKSREGWFNTGDIGARTRAGRVLLLDREVDRIPDGSCVELEDVLDDRLADIIECVIVGVPGRIPLPVVVTRDGRLDPTAWGRAVADLPPLADPVVLTWDELPRTATGKVRRAELRMRLLGTAATFGTGRWT